jgi:hypothetical protein
VNTLTLLSFGHALAMLAVALMILPVPFVLFCVALSAGAVLVDALTMLGGTLPVLLVAFAP